MAPNPLFTLQGQATTSSLCHGFVFTHIPFYIITKTITLSLFPSLRKHIKHPSRLWLFCSLPITTIPCLLLPSPPPCGLHTPRSCATLFQELRMSWSSCRCGRIAESSYASSQGPASPLKVGGGGSLRSFRVLFFLNFKVFVFLSQGLTNICLALFSCHLP